MKNFCLSEASVSKLLKYFPRVRKELLKKFEDQLTHELWSSQRLQGMRKEHLEITGFCSVTSNMAIKIIFEQYPEAKIVRGYFLMDKHPRFPGEKVSDLHVWIEIDDKIIDFTASQFNPFTTQKSEQLEITPINDPRYLRNLNKKPVALDEETIFEDYLSRI